MIKNFDTFKQKAQDKLLRLFVESDLWHSNPITPFYTCTRAGTHARLHM